jgi:uncharacterized protein with NRDE domain
MNGRTMCLIFLAYKQHPTYPIIIAANRDEFYQRKTIPAHFWKDHPHVLAGRDAEANGTWLGVNTFGKISLLTNYRDLSNVKSNAPSRGKLVSEFLINDTDAETYLKSVQQNSNHYNGFNLIVGTTASLWYHSNYVAGIKPIPPGIHGLSNHLLNTPWPKVEKGKEEFINAINHNQIDPERIFHVLANEDTAPVAQLPNTGIPITLEKALSARFIKTEGYGTRSSTIVLIDHQQHLTFFERTYKVNTQTTTVHFTFQLQPSVD